MILVCASFAVMLLVDARGWEGYLSLFRALFKTYNPLSTAPLADPWIMLGWGLLALSGAAGTATRIFLSRSGFKGPIEKVGRVLAMVCLLVVGAFWVKIDFLGLVGPRFSFVIDTAAGGQHTYRKRHQTGIDQ